MTTKRKACYTLIGFFFINIPLASSQNQKLADSLAIIYQQGDLQGEAKLELLRNLSFNEIKDTELSLQYANELIRLSREENNDLYLYRGYLQKGNNHRLTGDLEIALDALFKSVEAAIDVEYIAGEGSAYMSIADVYSAMGNAGNAGIYYNKAIQLLRLTTDSIALAAALLNTGEGYFENGKYDSALLYFAESGIIFKNVNYLIGTAYNLGNTGMVYARQGNDILAEANINEAITILEELEDYYPISVYLTYMADIYMEKGDEQAALNYAQRSLILARQLGLKKQISDANHKLSELYNQIGNLEESYKYYRDYIIYKDSVSSTETVQQMADLRTDFEVSQKQIEVDLLNQQKRNQQIIVIASVIAFILVFLLALGLYRRYIYIRKTNSIIEAEKNRSESLLLNILPEETARELKQSGVVEAKKFESATILFTDFRGFTKMAEHSDPEQLVRSIDFYFKKFDEITTRYGLEKIKTIGDSYMCAGGLPKVNQTHAKDVIHAGRDMIDQVAKELKREDDLLHFEIRIGVHTGPVVAGIVGTKKWQYDVWGDTVNIASRMESNSASGKVNLSETTYQEIKDEFPCEYRGEIEVKNRGSLKMYYLS